MTTWPPSFVDEDVEMMDAYNAARHYDKDVDMVDGSHWNRDQQRLISRAVTSTHFKPGKVSFSGGPKAVLMQLKTYLFTVAVTEERLFQLVMSPGSKADFLRRTFRHSLRRIWSAIVRMYHGAIRKESEHPRRRLTEAHSTMGLIHSASTHDVSRARSSSRRSLSRRTECRFDPIRYDRSKRA